MQFPGPVPYQPTGQMGPPAPAPTAAPSGGFAHALGQDIVGGLASGFMAEANRTGSGAGFAAGFAGAVSPTLEARRDRLDAASAARQYQAEREAFATLPAEVQELLAQIDQWGQIGATP